MNEPLKKADIISQTTQHAPASEGTEIEKSRAIAQVQGALIVAQQRPRDTMQAMTNIREACAIQQLAERAFFRYNRAGSNVSDMSIHLATELARCWGNIDFGITELRRDERARESEMLAYAWDLETNTRVVNSFIVPHKRDTKNGTKDLTDVRDIYENNANNAARRLRECIKRVIPTYVIEEAKTICMQTLQHGGGVPIEERREKLLEAYAGVGVTRQQIEKRVGVSADRMQAVDIANLRVVYLSISRGETNIADEFQIDRGGEISDDLRGEKPKQPAPTSPEPYVLVNELGEIVEEIASPGPYAEAVIFHIGRIKTPGELQTFAENNKNMTVRLTKESAGNAEAIAAHFEERFKELAEVLKQDAQPETQETPADEPQEPDGRPAPPDEEGMATHEESDLRDDPANRNYRVPLLTKANSDEPDWVAYYQAVKRVAMAAAPADMNAVRESNDDILERMRKSSAQNHKSLMKIIDDREAEPAE